MLELPFRCMHKRDFRAYWVNNLPPIVVVTFYAAGELEYLNPYRDFELRLPKPVADQFTIGEVYLFTVGPRRMT